MIHYFVKDNSDYRWNDIELVAWYEHENVLYTDKNEYKSSFDRVEYLRLFSNKEKNSSVSFKADFGRNTAIGHHARTPEELHKVEIDNASWTGPGSRQVTKKEYLEARGKLFETYKAYMFLNFESINIEN